MQDSRYVQRSNLDHLETESDVSKPKHITSGNKSTIGRLFVLDLNSGHIASLNAGGSDRKVIVSGCRHPEDLVVDVESGHITAEIVEKNRARKNVIAFAKFQTLKFVFNQQKR